MNKIREYSQQQLDDQAHAVFRAFQNGTNDSRKFLNKPAKSRYFVKWVLIVDTIGHKTILRVVHGNKLGLDRQNLDFEL